MKPDRAFLRIARKLEQAELEHLRTLCAELQARLEETERQRDRAIDDAHQADSMTRVFQDSYYEALDRIPADAPRPQLAIDQQGTVSIIDVAPAFIGLMEHLG